MRFSARVPAPCFGLRCAPNQKATHSTRQPFKAFSPCFTIAPLVFAVAGPALAFLGLSFASVVALAAPSPKTHRAKTPAANNPKIPSSLSATTLTPPAPVPKTSRSSVLSWNRCIELVNQNNADLAKAKNDIQAAEHQIDVTWYGNWLPGAQAEYTLSKDSRSGVQSDGSNVSLLLNENLFDGFKTTYTLKQNDSNLKTMKAGLRITQAKVSAELVDAYEGLRYAQAFKVLTESIIKRREENLRLVTLRFESGGENKGSVLLSSANLEQARFDDLQAGNAATLAQRKLAKVMGLDDHADFEIEEAIPLHDPESAPDIQSLAVDTPDYVNATASVEKARAGVGLARQPFFPQLNLRAGAGASGIETFPTDKDNWSTSVQIIIPWFSPFGAYFGIKQASSAYAAAENVRLSTARYLLVNLEQNYQGFVEAVARFKVSASFKDALIVRAEIARAKYKNGLITFDDWDIIENDLIQREKDYVSTERDRVNAEAAWSQAQGKGVL